MIKVTVVAYYKPLQKGMLGRQMEGGVVAKFDPRQPCNTLFRVGRCKIQQIHFNSVVDHLCLAICLWVVCRSKLEFHTVELENFLPKEASESRVPITN